MVKCGGAPPVMALCVLTQSWAYWSCSGTETLTLINTLMKLLQPQGFRHQWHFMWVTRHRHQWHLHTLYWAGITWAAVTAFVVSITLSAANIGSTHCVCLLSVTASVCLCSALSPSSFLCICFLLVWWENTASMIRSMSLYRTKAPHSHHFSVSMTLRLKIQW